MRAKLSLIIVAVIVACVFCTKGVLADPCGMVPPIYPSGQPIPLARIGDQQTYVFFKDGIETFVIRPGFTGKVDEFGMLIPFPTPPAIRKVPDQIFPHIAAAIDPPEVVVDLRNLFSPDESDAGAEEEGNSSGVRHRALRFDTVRVLRQEAVGMYEVAVLEAGSAAALKRWIDDHGYKYPDGMDEACNDYVANRWCFVAVKTKVGQKEGVDPRPGQRNTDSKIPDGSTFDGHVQGMGFRFKVEELVVPMRLSAFNQGELHNIVYLLTEGPRKIRFIPEEYVVRQVSGEQLYKNVTQPLPVRIIGGKDQDIPDFWRKSLPDQRNPAPHNGAAKDLFASDLLAVRNETLALPHEESEKELLRIGERFGLRGLEIDKLNEQSLAALREKTVRQSLADLKQMTLTVIDGDFPRELLAGQNLTFGEYKMPSRRNDAQNYDAKLKAPAPTKQGVLKLGRLEMPAAPRTEQNAHKASEVDNESVAYSANGLLWLLAMLIATTVGWTTLRRVYWMNGRTM